MFPTAGYFRSTNCPFFVHGLCHRPYCHFRHSKPGLKVSKSKISPHKLKTEEHRTAGSHVEHPEKGTSSDIKTGSFPPVHHENKLETSMSTSTVTTTTTTTTPTIKSILKKSNEETRKQSNQEDSPSTEHSMCTTVADSARTERISTESFDDMEQPFASLTDEEKKIIGLMSLPKTVSSDFGASKSLVTEKESVADSSSTSSSNNHASSLTNKENNGLVVSGEKAMNVNLHVTDTRKEVQIKVEISNDTTDKTRLTSKVTEEKEVEMQSDSSSTATAEKHDIVVCKEKASTPTEDKTDKISKKRKSVPLKTSTTVATTTKTSAEQYKDKTSLSDIVSKRKRSLQLPCATDGSSPTGSSKDSEKVNNSTRLKGSGEYCVKEQSSTALDEFLKSASKSLKEIECSTNISPAGKHTVVQNMMYVIPKKKKHGDESVNTQKRKMPMKEDSLETSPVKKKKVISEAQINFFGSTKVTKKGCKAEIPKKSRGKLSPVKKAKATKMELAGADKHKDVKKKFSKGVTILISDDSDAVSPANCDSSSEEDSHLKQIWDEYEPEQDFVNVLAEDLSVKSQAQAGTEVKMMKTYAAVAAVSTSEEKPSSLLDNLGFGKKQRVAHSANHLPRRLSSNANPIRRYPKTISAAQKKDQPTGSSTSVESAAEATATSYKPAKNRVAHVVKNSTPAGSLPRPRIPVEYGAKVPQSQRQRYLDRIIDECLRIYPTQKEAFDKAVEEEQALYERSTRRQVYLNLCVNAIKKLRDMKPQELPTASPVKTETVTRAAVTKTLPSGAVVISTKSPAKQDQAVTSSSHDLTEELMYDFVSKYLMSEEDLVENGYPRPCLSSPGKAVFKSNKEQPSKDSSRRICRRCGKPYVVLEDGEYLTREECIYHAGKLFRKRGEQSYSCCQGDAGSPGCCVGKVHVCDDTGDADGFMTTIRSPLADHRKVYAMDCEMCYTTAGLELTRITVVNWKLEQVYDSFVMPERAIVDYNTRFSGVTEEALRGVTTTIREVQAVLLSMIHKDTILVGHSLESDLKATKLIHSKVVDTSLVFPHRLGPPYKRALRNLMADFLKKIIQDSVEGHDSYEDARACLELMRWKVKEDMKTTARHKSTRLSLG